MTLRYIPEIGANLMVSRMISDDGRPEERNSQTERLAVLGQIFTELVHESGNILQRAQAGLELLVLETKDNPSVGDLIEIQQRALSDLSRLYGQVRNYAAPIHLDRSTRELPSIWRLAWNDLKPNRASRCAVLREEIECSDLLCRVDFNRMGQVFRNLMSNSLEACPDSVNITITESQESNVRAVRVNVYSRA